MIGVFDSGVGGLTILRTLVERFPTLQFHYFGDQANVPYGNRTAEEIVALTQSGVEHLFSLGCRLVILGCNTATAVAARTLQQTWLRETGWHQRGHNVLGIVAPTVEVATQTPWAVTTPQYPQKFNADRIIVFGTTITVSSGVYCEEIRKRCPRATVVEVACAGLAGAIEDRAGSEKCDRLVAAACRDALKLFGGRADSAILGCTHFPLVAEAFARHLPAGLRVLSQPGAVADSLEDYLARHPYYAERDGEAGAVMLTTSGDPAHADDLARIFWPNAPGFERI